MRRPRDEALIGGEKIVMDVGEVADGKASVDGKKERAAVLFVSKQSDQMRLERNWRFRNKDESLIVRVSQGCRNQSSFCSNHVRTSPHYLKWKRAV